MKFGIPVGLFHPSHFLPVAVAADECGFHSAAVPDSVFFPEQVSAKYPYTEDGSRFWGPEAPFVDPWVAIPAMAAVTKRLHLYTSVMKLPLRNPLLVAKTVSSAAVLSGNRVGLGVGLSWIPEEFKWCGSDYAARGQLVDEAIEIIRLVVGGGMVEYHGKHYDFDRLQISPTPDAPVPIYVGGLTKPALRRAARLGDGWISVQNSEAELKMFIAELRQYREEYGVGDRPFEIKGSCTDVFDLDGYKRLEEAGMTELTVAPWYLYGGDPDSLETKKAGIQRFADDVIAKFP
ncbi:MAG: TIGR03619 family F420-dependent LLM class oxidoreductase [Chloroflexi bacterium]|nr:TIGR03619 family F420-dependent LLM class oxidoreductase [Chloroflexota bacterium]